jgi:hypothetical protein
MNSLLDSYPRQRPPLSEAMAARYVTLYQQSRNGVGLVFGITQKLEAWIHRKVAAVKGAPVLELGAGTLNHVAYEDAAVAYDIVEPFTALYAHSPALSRVRQVFDDVAAVPLEAVYGRVISIGVLEHMTDLPRCMARAALALVPGGVFQAGIPSEGGLLWGLTWRMSVGLWLRLRSGLSYGEMMRHEHVNSAREILALTAYFFEDVRVQYFPLPHVQASLYIYIEARRPRRERCEAYAFR